MEDLTGRQFGSYRIVKALGEGGMAAVYQAYQPGMDRYVALKVLPRHFASDPQFVSRFRHEARILAQLQHPHILPVFDFGESDGFTFLAMPFVQGGTLGARLDGKPLPLATVQRIIRQVCEAIGYAHTKGVVHRDIKPSNILIDETSNCLVADFGLARLVDGHAKLTVTGALIGTPAYMSPEQAEGKPAGPASDVYALGIVLYEMLTGRVPFTAETPVAVLVKHLNAPLPPPRTFNPGIGPAIEAVVLKALARATDDRFVTPLVFSDALGAAISSTLHATTVGPEDIATRKTVVTPRPPSAPRTPHGHERALPAETIHSGTADRVAASPQTAALRQRHGVRFSSAILIAIAGIAAGAAGVGFYVAARFRETPTVPQALSRGPGQVAREPAPPSAPASREAGSALTQAGAAEPAPKPPQGRDLDRAQRSPAQTQREHSGGASAQTPAVGRAAPLTDATPLTKEAATAKATRPSTRGVDSSTSTVPPLPFGFNGELQPGRSTRASVERALGAPIQQISQYVYDYQPQAGTTVLYVVYRADDVMDAIGVSFVQPYSRNYIVRTLNLPAEPQSSRQGEGHLFEYFGAPAYIVLAYPSTDARSGVLNLRHYSAEMFNREAPPARRVDPGASGDPPPR